MFCGDAGIQGHNGGDRWSIFCCVLRGSYLGLVQSQGVLQKRNLQEL